MVTRIYGPMTGAKMYRLAAIKTEGRKPDWSAFTQLEALEVLTEDPPAAAALLEFANGDLRNLEGVNAANLIGIPHVGKGTAGKIIALVLLFQHWAAPAPQTQEMEKNPMGIE